VDNTLENVCENMVTLVHKVILLVVGTFEQGDEVGEVVVVFLTEKHAPDAGAMSTGHRVAHPVS
jgi:hypothetical protein